MTNQAPQAFNVSGYSKLREHMLVARGLLTLHTTLNSVTDIEHRETHDIQHIEALLTKPEYSMWLPILNPCACPLGTPHHIHQIHAP